MSNSFYPVSNQFYKLMNGETIPKISLKQSIIEHLYVLLSTIPGEYLYNKLYGCELLSTEFNIEKEENEISTLVKYIQDSVVKFEPRVDPENFICIIKFDIVEKDFTPRKLMKLNLEIYTKDTQQKIPVYIEYFLSPFAIA